MKSVFFMSIPIQEKVFPFQIEHYFINEYNWIHQLIIVSEYDWISQKDLYVYGFPFGTKAFQSGIGFRSWRDLVAATGSLLRSAARPKPICSRCSFYIFKSRFHGWDRDWNFFIVPGSITVGKTAAGVTQCRFCHSAGLSRLRFTSRRFSAQCPWTKIPRHITLADVPEYISNQSLLNPHHALYLEKVAIYETISQTYSLEHRTF